MIRPIDRHPMKIAPKQCDVPLCLLDEEGLEAWHPWIEHHSALPRVRRFPVGRVGEQHRVC
jgi:hypothetical protein